MHETRTFNFNFWKCLVGFRAKWIVGKRTINWWAIHAIFISPKRLYSIHCKYEWVKAFRSLRRNLGYGMNKNLIYWIFKSDCSSCCSTKCCTIVQYQVTGHTKPLLVNDSSVLQINPFHTNFVCVIIFKKEKFMLQVLCNFTFIFGESKISIILK